LEYNEEDDKMNFNNIKNIVIAGSAALAIAAASLALPSIAEARGGGGFGTGGFGGGHFGGGIAASHFGGGAGGTHFDGGMASNHSGGSVGGGRFNGSVASRLGQLRGGEGALGHSRFVHDGYGYGYYGYYSCGPTEQAEGLCNPYYSY
jgi:hypothetical protein